ncbi:glycosyltransferase family 4 protein [Budvicia diplopodorum]|uniref:glycosyltransferase family 4 protein n=1 Tax=Budvicia diplopodorum TaxID=1119056 RepID=UPI0013579A72|nr:glycosyltransferase family 4 protein [Budvicia diplopodorum]
MKILLLTQWFDPEPTFKGLLFAKELQANGHEVEVITGFPNYPGGKIYDGYKIKFIQREYIDGIKVTRVPLYPSHDNSAIKRIFNYISFSFSATLYGIFGAKKPDVIYIYHPPLTSGVAGAVIGFFRRAPYVIDIQDLWPDTLKATGMVNNQKVLNIVQVVCNWVYHRATKIVVLSSGFKNRLIQSGQPENKISVIYNWCDESALDIDKSSRLPAEGFNIVFAGNLGRAQGLDTVLLAAMDLSSNERRINFIFVGSGVVEDELKQTVKDKLIDNVYFIPRLPMKDIGGVLKEADALLVHLKDEELFSITIPSKTQAYMSIGKPVIMGGRGDAADIIIQADAGIVCEPENVESLKQAVICLSQLTENEIEKLGKNAEKFYLDEMSLSAGCKKFISVFDDAIRMRKL